MSTIGVKCHNEDIHNIIHKPMSPTPKSPRYKSKKTFLIKELNEKKKYNGHQTFGLPHYEAPKSWNFLRKGKPKVLPPAVKFINKKEFKCTINCKSSPIPKCSNENTRVSGKNFVKENIKKVAAIQSKSPCPRKVETPRGTVKEMAHLLQMIKIRQSDQYGKIPKYLCQRRIQWEKEKEKKRLEELAVKEYKERMGIGTMGMSENVYMIDHETRQKLLNGLKENWNELSKQFLKLPVMIDTWPKIKRKMWLEKEIDQLEKDVKLVESHPYIYLERIDKRPFEVIVAEEIKLRQNEREKYKTEEKSKDSVLPSKLSLEENNKIPPENLAHPEKPPADEKKEEDEELKILNY